jgi:hypothetical protein
MLCCLLLHASPITRLGKWKIQLPKIGYGRCDTLGYLTQASRVGVILILDLEAPAGANKTQRATYIFRCVLVSQSIINATCQVSGTLRKPCDSSRGIGRSLGTEKPNEWATDMSSLSRRARLRKGNLLATHQYVCAKGDSKVITNHGACIRHPRLLPSPRATDVRPHAGSCAGLEVIHKAGWKGR